MIRLIFGGYCLALLAMFIGAAVQADQPDPSAPVDTLRNVPLPTYLDIEIARATAEAHRQAMIDGILQSIIIDKIVYPTPQEYVDYNDDGLLDLVRIEVDGIAYVYLNSGTNENPIYTKAIKYEGDQTIVDKLIQAKQDQQTRQRDVTTTSVDSWVELNYDRFDVFIEQEYYNNNQADLDLFFDQFEPRFNLLEQTTGWSSETFYDSKLRIELEGVDYACYGGYAGSGEVNLRLSDPLYMQGCQNPYYIDGTFYWDNPGELGDWWPYMGITIHEATHAINPNPILFRRWLTEGFGRYYEHNIILDYGDINQETTDIYIYQGDSQHNWEDYINNDYHDNCTAGCFIEPEAEIQNSRGYSITAWMFTMLKEDYSLDWEKFYNLMSTNYETLDKSYNINPGYRSIQTDMVVIDMFGRALDMDFNEIKTVFQYDGPEGPGWGVRQWVATDWYADLTPGLSFSNATPNSGQTIDLIATVYNNGDTDANDFSVRFYEGVTLLDEQIISVPANSSLLVTSPYTGSEGLHTFSVFVDEDNIKMETDETNNETSESVTFVPCCDGRVGDANGSGADEPTIGDISTLIDAKFISGSCVGTLDCFAEADINQSGGLAPACDDITIGDISFLIDYLFITGPILGLPDCL